MTFSSTSILLSALACGAVAVVVVACGSDESKFAEPKNNQSFTDGGFDNNGEPPGIDAASDPAPPWCGPAGTSDPLGTITGSPECPSDKNMPGCGCENIGDTAPCWTGFRRDRHLGNCKDGTAKCIRKNETSNMWGDCEGEVLPTPNSTGAAACSCFSLGEWKIANTSPCIANGGAYAYSALYDSNGDSTNCGSGKPVTPQGQVPAGSWSTNTLKVDCAGKFKLCFRIRAGDFNHPSASDCILGEACVDADIAKENVETPLPDLPAWAGQDNACAAKWGSTPPDQSQGYGEMIVKGQTVRCDEVDDGAGNDFVFHRVQYCPKSCQANPNTEACQACSRASSGTFN
jgi:hypothetical protein